MTLEQIKQAVTDGKTVHWANTSYEVVLDSVGQWLIIFKPNGNCIGLTSRDGLTMNGSEDDFFLA